MPRAKTAACIDCGKPDPSGRRCNSCQHRKWCAENPERVAERSANGWAQQLKHKYRLTADQYFEMLDRQNGVCVICEQPPRQGRRLSVDHDHDCCPGKRSCGECIRSLLCSNCNAILGMAAERVDVLQAAIDYLRGA